MALAQKQMVVKMNNKTSQEFILNDINEVTYCVLCPDENHPHMIDLGLPSGTKWACCNIGASSPEEYGGYYSWGETEIKDYYDIEHYIYWYGPTGGQLCNYIGDDIASTQYDVAYVKWGAPWHMPTDAQQDELRWNCTKEWTQLNGVYGILVIGPNDAAIFMPAAGCRDRDFLYRDIFLSSVTGNHNFEGYTSDTLALQYLSSNLPLSLDTYRALNGSFRVEITPKVLDVAVRCYLLRDCLDEIFIDCMI